MSNKNLKNLSNEEIDKVYHQDPSDEDVYKEYSSRQNWQTPPDFSSPEEEEKFIETLINKAKN